MRMRVRSVLSTVRQSTSCSYHQHLNNSTSTAVISHRTIITDNTSYLPADIFKNTRRNISMFGPSGDGSVSETGPYAVSVYDIIQASKRTKDLTQDTPVLTCSTIDKLAGRKIHFKCELFQKSGAFKFRGALNAVRRILEENNGTPTSDLSVVTHSSGNHGQALSLAAQLCGVKCYVVMPTDAPVCKRTAVEGYGGLVIDCEPNEQARAEAADRVVRETGATLIHPNQHPDVIAGQGTMAIEIMNNIRNIDAIVAPVGGGGMIAGIALATKARKPAIQIFGAEPLNADDCARSYNAKELIKNSSPPKTVCDGLKTSLGEVTFPVIRDLLTDVITVTEEEIIDAMRLVWERMKLVIEPSSAVGVAAVLSEKFKSLPKDQLKNVAVILCGGNVDIDNLPWSSTTSQQK